MPAFGRRRGPRNDDGVAKGDFRGPYGYGRPAHRTDPEARYVFEPERVRPLPIRSHSLLSKLYHPDPDESQPSS